MCNNTIKSRGVLPENAIILSGIVKDEMGDAVPLAHVYVKNSKRGTSTDENGNYDLGIVMPGDIIVFSVNTVITEIEASKVGKITVVNTLNAFPEITITSKKKKSWFTPILLTVLGIGTIAALSSNGKSKPVKARL